MIRRSGFLADLANLLAFHSIYRGVEMSHVKYEEITEHGHRILASVIRGLGITEADIKKITPTHVHTWSGRKIEHNLTINIPETIHFS